MFDKIINIFAKKDPVHKYYVDIHSHLIPGIDDGSKSMDESIELIGVLKGLGFKKIITTPHIMQHRYPNTSDIIRQGLVNVQKELIKRNIDIDIEAASEYYFDEHLLELINKRDILTFGDNYLLFELPYHSKPINLESVIFEMIVAGYKPVLAHPERYVYIHKNLEEYEKLKETGILFQINLNSFDGYYSKPVQKVANFLSDKGLIDFIGSDTHKARHLEHFSKNINSKIIDKIFEKNKILNDHFLSST